MGEGVCQRVRAINAFLDDIYHEQHILKSGRIPASLVLNNPVSARGAGPRPAAPRLRSHRRHRRPRLGQRLLRARRQCARAVRRLLHAGEPGDDDEAVPRAVRAAQVAPVNHYPEMLLRTLRSVAPPGIIDPTVVVMTPGHYNSAYFEHAFLSMQMGVEWSRAGPVRRGRHGLHAHHQGPRRVDVIYRRIDDDFIDPLAFDAGSLLGVPGLLSVVRNGRVSLANAIGTGVADDKAIYCFVPDMIDFYLGEKPILKNAHLPLRGRRRSRVRHRSPGGAGEEVGGSGGYGMLVGPMSTAEQRHDFRSKLLSDPATSSPSRPSTCQPCRPWSTARCRGTSICGPTC